MGLLKRFELATSWPDKPVDLTPSPLLAAGARYAGFASCATGYQRRLIFSGS